MKPIQCDIEITDQCILRCKMCNIWKNSLSGHQDRRYLNPEEYKKLLFDLKHSMGTSFLISFSGGEILLYADKILEVFKIANDLGFATYFPTNAYLIDEDMAKKIAQAGVYSLGISLDGINKKTHDFIRGKGGSWERIMLAIEYLKKYSSQTAIDILAIIMNINLDEIIELTEWVYANPRLRRIAFQAIQKPFNTICQENWYELEEYCDLWPQDIDKVNSIIDKLILLKHSCNDGYKISNPVSQLEQFKSYFVNPRLFVKSEKCHMDKVMRIDSYGNARMCDEMGIIGNIRDSSIERIWYSKKADEIRQKISNCIKNCHYLVNCYYLS